MKTPDDQLLGRWLDGELTADERPRFEAMMAADPDLKREAESMKQMGDLLRAHVPLERELPHADFFNSQIQERIAADQRAEERAKGEPASASWFSWLRTPWSLAAVAAVLTVGFFVLQEGKPQTQILSLYAPNPAIHATSYHSSSANATVLMLDGLDAIPAEANIVGLNVHSSENDTAYATTTLFDERGDVVLVMSKDARNQPVFLGRKG